MENANYMKNDAYLIMAHKEPDLLRSLIQCLDSKKHDIFIHIDKKSQINLEDICDCVNESNVFVFKEKNVSWGGV